MQVNGNVLMRVVQPSSAQRHNPKQKLNDRISARAGQAKSRRDLPRLNKNDRRNASIIAAIIRTTIHMCSILTPIHNALERVFTDKLPLSALTLGLLIR